TTSRPPVGIEIVVSPASPGRLIFRQAFVLVCEPSYPHANRRIVSSFLTAARVATRNGEVVHSTREEQASEWLDKQISCNRCHSPDGLEIPFHLLQVQQILTCNHGEDFMKFGTIQVSVEKRTGRFAPLRSQYLRLPAASFRIIWRFRI